jgi:hypothetical protein
VKSTGWPPGSGTTSTRARAADVVVLDLDEAGLEEASALLGLAEAGTTRELDAAAASAGRERRQR